MFKKRQTKIFFAEVTQNESVYMGGIYNFVLFYNTALH